MSDVNVDEPGFTAPAGSAPPSSVSSVDHPPDGRSKCVACPRRMSAKTTDRHTLCVVCRGLIVPSIPAARSVWSGLRRRCVCMPKCANP